ncbi:putative ribonuclease H-like domain-containing protein, partial [Tanacetum coccineum]
SNTDVQSCSKNCAKTNQKLQKQFDEQRQTLNKANLEIVAYQLGLESVEAQLVVYQKNEVVYEEKIAVLYFEEKDKGNAITRLTNQLKETLREKEDFKAKLEYVFDSRSSDGDDNQTNDKFKKGDRYHAVPHPLTGNYIPPLADLSFAGLDDFVYRPIANKSSAGTSNGEASDTQTNNISVEMPKVDNVRTNGVIIEDWVSDDEDKFQSVDPQTTVKPSFKKIEFTKARNESVKTNRQTDKPKMITQNPKVDKRDWNGKSTQKLGLGFGFTKKTCFVCGSHNHLINDSDFHEKRMTKKSILNDKGTGHRDVRPNWNNTQRINHQNKFVPTAVLTRTRRISWIMDLKKGNQKQALKYKGMFNSRCSRHMTWNKALLTDYQDIVRGFVAFSGSTRGGKITEFKNSEMDEFCGQKRIKREYNVAKTPQQNGVAERKNRTLIEAARTMLADSLLPTVFWAKAVNTACYVLNRVLVTKPHKKTPYELIIGRAPSISFMRPFRCPITILNTLDPLGKFDRKAEEGFLVGYSVNSKAFKVFNTETIKVEENLHVNFLENKPNATGQGPNWLFDIDSLTNSMNYQLVTARNQTNKNTGPRETNGNIGLKKNVDAGQTEEGNVSSQ